MIDIAVGASASSKSWKNRKMSWQELTSRLANGVKTAESYTEFISMSKADQGKIKDVGGYVGGYLKDGKRSPRNVVHRQLLTLDIDFAHIDFWGDFQMMYDCAAILHATHKHCEASPRFRLVIPISRKASADEYVAVARRVAGDIGIELFDNTTFEVNRLMFWPSVPRDVGYYFQSQDGPWLDVDKVLGTYVDWRDSSAWPTAEARIRETHAKAAKQEDPEVKKGIVGAWCRTYSIEEILDGLLSDRYVRSTVEDRWTYKEGTAAAGLIVYDNKFAFSHHGTDPVSGRLVNAFDLCRIHLYGHLDSDAEEQSRTTRLPSYRAMEDHARADERVKMLVMEERLQDARYDFNQDDYSPDAEEDVSWAKALEVDGKGKYLSNSTNISLILANDSRLRGAFRHNEFDNKAYVFESLPWRRVTHPEPMRDVDYSGVRNYIESIYGITGVQKIDDALSLEFEKNRYHPIRDYLTGLKWDGTERLDTLLIDYFGAEDSIYTREAIRKMLTAAVARVMRPGVKFDLVLTLVGAQGTGKSTFVKMLGREWFSDTFITVQGKEALEQIQGAWLIEMAELAGIRKAEVEAIKHFISKSEDVFRKAYGHITETYKRQCIFFGTTNNLDFLRDPSGNRRFLPVDIYPQRAYKDVWLDLPDEVDQIWAEAVKAYEAGEQLYLSREAELIARREQAFHSEVDERRGLIEKYLERELPASWDKLDLGTRRMYLSDDAEQGEIKRHEVCVAELWCECLGKSREDMSRYNTKELNDIMRSLDGWVYSSSTRYFPLYGKQRYYARREK